MSTSENQTQGAAARHDILIVGASVAGCFTALKLAQQGFRVALLEQHSEMTHYKKVCTHIIQPDGVRLLKSIGIYDTLLSQGGQATYMELLTENGTLFFPLSRKTHAANIERQYLDPSLKKRVAKEPNIRCYWGYRVDELIRETNRIVGVRANHKQEYKINLYASLVIAADGKKSRIARLDNTAEKTIRSNRVALFAYVENRSDLSQTKIWSFERGRRYITYFPNGKRALLSCYLPFSSYQKHKHNIQQYYDDAVKTFVNKTGLPLGNQLSQLLVAKDTSTLYRKPNSTGLAFVGDAFLTVDPLTGIGCSWAMKSADLLSRNIAKALVAKEISTADNRQAIDTAVKRYQRLHKLHFLIPAYAMSILSSKGHLLQNPILTRIISRLIGEQPAPEFQ